MVLLRVFALLLFLAVSTESNRGAKSRRKGGRGKLKVSTNCNFEPSKSNKKSTIKTCKPFWTVHQSKCTNSRTNGTNGSRRKCPKFDWKLVNEKDSLVKDKIDSGRGHFLMVSARQTKDKDKAKALFETKSFRFKPTKRCLKFKQAMYCENNCKPNPYGAMALRVFVEVLNWGKKKDGTNGAPIKIWERIDSRKNGQWLESEIDIQKSLKDKKKRAKVKKLRITFEAQRGDTRNAIVAIDDIKFGRCPKPPKPQKPEKAEQPKPCKGEFCPQIEVADLEGIFLEPPGQLGSYEALADAPQAAQVPEDLSIRLDTDYEWPSRPDSPDISYEYFDEEVVSPNAFECDYKTYVTQISTCISRFNQSKPKSISCRDNFDALIRCVQDVAGLCALKNDDYENVKNGRIREKVENFIEKDLDLYNSYCGEPDEFPNYDLSRTEAECPEDFEHDLTKCMTQFTKKYIYIKADASELCHEWVGNLQCKEDVIATCHFKNNLNMLLAGIGNTVQNSHVMRTFCLK